MNLLWIWEFLNRTFHHLFSDFSLKWWWVSVGIAFPNACVVFIVKIEESINELLQQDASCPEIFFLLLLFGALWSIYIFCVQMKRKLITAERLRGFFRSRCCLKASFIASSKLHFTFIDASESTLSNDATDSLPL